MTFNRISLLTAASAAAMTLASTADMAAAQSTQQMW